MSGSASLEALTAPRWISASPSPISSIATSPRASTSFKQRNTGGNLRMGFPIADNTQMGLRYRFEREEIFDASNNASLAVVQAAQEGPVNVSSIGYTIAYDTRNIPSSPTSGIFASFSQDFAGVGGDVNYIRSVADARGYYPITNKVTLVIG